MSPAAPQPEGAPGGLAAGVRWDLSHLYAGPDDPRIDGDLDRALEAAARFAERLRGRVARVRAPQRADGGGIGAQPRRHALSSHEGRELAQRAA